MSSAISRIARVAPSGAARAHLLTYLLTYLRPCLLTCLLAGTAHAAPAASIPAADPATPVAPTRYRPSAAYRPLSAEPLTPDRAWKEQNRIVGAAPGHDHAAPGAGAHAGHTMPAPAPADPHAGHTMPAAAPARQHEGHH